MRIVQINGGAKGSTGKIMMGIADVARAQGHEVMCASPEQQAAYTPAASSFPLSDGHTAVRSSISRRKQRRSRPQCLPPAFRLV